MIGLFGMNFFVLFCLLICFETVIGYIPCFQSDYLYFIDLTRMSCDQRKEIRILFHVTCLYL